MSGFQTNQENILAEYSSEIMADVYLVELSNRFSVISCAPRSRRLLQGADISEILSFDVSHELRKYLLSYGEMPLVIPTFVGDALILPQLFASSRLFLMAFFKRERPRALARVATSERFSGRVELLGGGEFGKPTKWDKPLADKLAFLLDVTDDIMTGSKIGFLEDDDVKLGKLDVLFSAISELTGVRAELSVADGIRFDECFDSGLFNAFCLSTFMLCGRYAKSEVAEVRIFQKDFGLTVGISFSSAKRISRVSNPDVAHFAAISDANNMIFESRFERGRYETVFTPARKDWSLLELKFPSEFTI